MCKRSGRAGYTNTGLPFGFLTLLLNLAKAFPAVPTSLLQLVLKGRGGWHCVLGTSSTDGISQKLSETRVARGNAKFGQIQTTCNGSVRNGHNLDTKAAFLIAFHFFQEPENSNPKHPAPAAMGGKRSKWRAGDQV